MELKTRRGRCHVCGKLITEREAYARLTPHQVTYLICCPMCMTALKAGQVQRRMIPQSFRNERLAVLVEYLPVMQVGGDFACFHPCGKDAYYLVIGDVSGHGVTSSLLMSWVTRDVERMAEAGEDVGVMAEKLNESLRSMLGKQPQYLTLFCSLLDLSSQRLTYVNCGHPSPFLWSQEKKSCFGLEPPTMPVGLVGPETFGVPEKKHVDVGEGDRLMLFTDGIPELKRTDGTRLGDEGVLQVFKELVHTPEDRLPRILGQKLQCFKELQPEDDLLLIFVALHSIC